jgi:bifunctional non-homologous end joining protein LigD
MARRARPPGSRKLVVDGYDPLRGGKRAARDPAQPALPFDPMPGRIDPCLALLAEKPPEGPEWAYEIKWDGYRLFVHKENAKVTLITRGGMDWTAKFPAIAQAALALPVATAILDGEAVVLDERGRSDFSALVAVVGKKRSMANDPILFMAFDLLYFDGHDISRMDQEERRHLLEEFVPNGQGGAIRLSEAAEEDGAGLFEAAREHGLEGIVAKRRDAPYRAGRKGEWRKIKCIQREVFIIVGFQPSRDGGLACLLLSAQSDDGLKYVGTVGTGFTQKTARSIREKLERIQSSGTKVNTARRGVVFVEPRIGALVEFRAWTASGHLRHGAFKGIVEHSGDDIYNIDAPQ